MNEYMTMTVENFRHYWRMEKGFMELVYSDEEIQEFLDEASNMEIAIDRAADHHLSQGLGWVQE